jgi:hypothetical protein
MVFNTWPVAACLSLLLATARSACGAQVHRYEALRAAPQNIWSLETRSSTDGIRAPLLSSLPRGESGVETLRSRAFSLRRSYPRAASISRTAEIWSGFVTLSPNNGNALLKCARRLPF